MDTTSIMITVAVAIVAVALMVLGLAITMIHTGEPLRGDVGDNPDMQRLGLECTTMAALHEEALLRGEDFDASVACHASSCVGCNVGATCKK
ncbi:MAG: hypothetical protein RSC07_05115 [Mucinivorans sp.]